MHLHAGYASPGVPPDGGGRGPPVPGPPASAPRPMGTADSIHVWVAVWAPGTGVEGRPPLSGAEPSAVGGCCGSPAALTAPIARQATRACTAR